MTAIEKAPLLKARDLDENFRLLAEFNGISPDEKRKKATDFNSSHGSATTTAPAWDRGITTLTATPRLKRILPSAPASYRATDCLPMSNSWEYTDACGAC